MGDAFELIEKRAAAPKNVLQYVANLCLHCLVDAGSVLGGYLAEMDVAAMKEAGLSMDELVEKLRASMSSVSPTAWQVRAESICKSNMAVIVMGKGKLHRQRKLSMHQYKKIRHVGSKKPLVPSITGMECHMDYVLLCLFAWDSADPAGVQQLQSALKHALFGATNVQVQEMGEGVATGRGVGPWMVSGGCSSLSLTVV
eukprot:1160879-Pelagomonas_calceolata.AAC.2